MTTRYEEEDLGRIRPTSVHGRDSKVHVGQFIDPESASGGAAENLIEKFPRILKGDDLRRVVEAMRQFKARARRGRNSPPAGWPDSAYIAAAIGALRGDGR